MLQSKNVISLCLCLVLAVLAGCSVSTANLSSLKLSKDKAGTQESSSFKPTETVYALATVSNNPSKVSVKGRILIEAVEGEKPGPIPGLETVVELAESGVATYTFSPPQAGWPVGKYKVEVLMMNEENVQKDQKVASFSIEP